MDFFHFFSADLSLRSIGTNKRIMIQTLKKGDCVITTGYGRTKKWGNKVGTVTKRRGDKVFILWEGTKFHIEDEMDIKEVRPDDGVKINKK